ncbi:phage tail protein [Streptomyces sp. NPDC046939]|uniref:phage tail tube protein n=1 Tax=Streptomyces sp. NPDC046939 TaxID=3155376 RepID=UPI003400470C
MASPNTSAQIRVAGTGKVLVAKYGATPAVTVPADTKAAWSADWTELGYTSTDGVKLAKKDKIDQVDGWQSVSALRYIHSDRELTLKFQLLQINKATLPFFMGGGATSAVTATGAEAGTFKYDLATNPTPDERMLGFEFSDTKNGVPVVYRLIVPRGQVTDTEEISMTRTGAIKLGVTFTAYAQDDTTLPLATWLMKDDSYA